MLYRKVNRSQNLMFVPTCIDDYAPADSKPRFIVETIESMDLTELYSKYSSKGSEAKDPAAMLATWVLAYSEGITSSRVLEKQELEAKLIQRQKQLEERKKELKKEHREKHRINIIEPEARNMGGVSGNQLLPAYNAQVSVEGKNNFIVAQDIVTDPNDQNQLSKQVENVNENVGEDPERKSTLDCGYHAKEQLQYGEQEKLDLVVADPAPENRSTKTVPTPIDTILKEKDRKVERSDFVFHQQDDNYECPAGEKLEFKNTYKKGNVTGRVYEKATPCTGCPSLERCFDKRNKSSIKRIYSRRVGTNTLPKICMKNCKPMKAKNA